MVFVTEQSGFEILKTVVLGYCDVSNAGARVLLGLNPSGTASFTLTHSDQKDPLLKNPEVANNPSIQITNLSNAQTSFIILNFDIEPEKSAGIARDLIELFVKYQVEKVIIPSSIDFQTHAKPGVFRIAYNWKESAIASLNETIPIQDEFLSQLLNFLFIKNLPTLALVCNAKKPVRSVDDDNTLSAIHQLASALNKTLGIEFSQEKILKWKLSHPNAKGSEKLQLMREDLLYI